MVNRIWPTAVVGEADSVSCIQSNLIQLNFADPSYRLIHKKLKHHQTLFEKDTL